MKRTIETLEKIKKEKSFTARQIFGIEVLAKLCKDIRESTAYKTARNMVFNHHGEINTACSVDIDETIDGYTLRMIERKGTEVIDWKAYALSLGGSEEHAKMQGFTTTRAGCTSVEVKKI